MNLGDADPAAWTDLRFCQLDGIRVSETVVSAGRQLDDHLHETGQICYVLEGEMRERGDGSEYFLRSGALRSRAPGFRHTVSASSESDVLALLLFIEHDRWIRVASERPIRADALLTGVADQIRHELGQLDDSARAALEGWTMLALSAAARRPAEAEAMPPQWLGEAIATIEQRACEPISLTTLAATLSIHRATLAAAFRRFKNTSVGEAIREARVRRVMRALLRNKRPLCEIATVCGFHDQAHMGRVFRRTTGMTPGAFRSLRR
jgi:AraC family transcriptional regulator